MIYSFVLKSYEVKCAVGVGFVVDRRSFGSWKKLEGHFAPWMAFFTFELQMM